VSREGIYPSYNKRKKANRIVQILRKNCLLKHVIEGNIEKLIKMPGRRKIKSKQPP
jgi:hypothetical protein